MGNVRGRALAAAVRRKRLTYLDSKALTDLYRAARHLAVPGVVIEAGTALGGSAAMLAAAIGGSRELHLYDTFGMIPAPSSTDGQDVHDRYAEIRLGKSAGIGEDIYYGYRNDLRDHVERTVLWASRNIDVTLHQGLYEKSFWPSGSVALVHLDCDWYESVKVCLERVWPFLSPGGRVIIDDYYAWSGARKAVDEFNAETAAKMECHARLHLVKW